MAVGRNPFKVGLMTIVVIATAIAVLLWLSSGPSGKMRPVTIRFDSDPSMPTLSPGSAVLMGGQLVGKVVRVGWPSTRAADREGDRAYYVKVEAEIDKNLVLRTDYRIFAEGPPLGGDGIIKIDAGSAEDTVAEGAPLSGSAPAGFGAIMAALQSELNGDDPGSLLGRIKTELDPGSPASLMAKLLQSMDDLNAVTSSARTEFDPAQRAALLAKLHELMDNVNCTTGALRAEFDAENPSVLLGKIHMAMDAVNSGLSALSRIMHDNEPVVDRTLAHVASTAEKLDNRIAENIARQTDPAFVEGMTARLNRAATHMNAILEDIQVVTGTTREVVVLNRENINKLLLNFKETSDHLRSASKYVLERPWRLLQSPSDTETRQHDIFDAARNFADAATRLDDATAQLKALSEMHNGNIPTDSPDLAGIRDRLERTSKKFNRAETELWKQLGVK